MPQFFDRHNVNAPVHKARSKSVTQRVPRHPGDSSLAPARANPALRSWAAVDETGADDLPRNVDNVVEMQIGKHQEAPR
jgi:hypothetical protein